MNRDTWSFHRIFHLQTRYKSHDFNLTNQKSPDWLPGLIEFFHLDHQNKVNNSSDELSSSRVTWRRFAGVAWGSRSRSHAGSLDGSMPTYPAQEEVSSPNEMLPHVRASQLLPLFPLPILPDGSDRKLDENGHHFGQNAGTLLLSGSTLIHP